MSSIERHQPSDAQLERMDRRIRRVAEVLAKTKLVPEKLQRNPDAIEAILTSAAELGIPPTVQAVNQFYIPKDGQVGSMAQLQLAKAAQHGYDVWTPAEECSDDEAVAYVKRPDGRTFRERFTIADAEKMGLLEVWPDSGKPKKDNWAHAPALMLRYRAITKAIKLHAPGLMLGFEGWGRHFDEVDDRSEGAGSETRDYEAPPADAVDAEIVDEPAKGVVARPAASDAPEAEGGQDPPPEPPSPPASWEDRFLAAVRAICPDWLAVAALQSLIVERAIGYVPGVVPDRPWLSDLTDEQRAAVGETYASVRDGALEPVRQGHEVVLEEVAP